MLRLFPFFFMPPNYWKNFSLLATKLPKTDQGSSGRAPGTVQPGGSEQSQSTGGLGCCKWSSHHLILL